ncbi:hypothetical protein KY313_01180 [Candidatus Woesearchaeota archaeon]|jgi:hypothetical protein|nr:hypothetical protein [Candidatus Woesearchaeota archaeon]
MAKNKLALLFTGISCFALDSLLQTPMLSSIGFTLILVSGIWFVGSHARATPARTFTSRFKEEWKATKGMEKKEKKIGRKLVKEEKEIKHIDKKERKQAKEETNIADKMIEAIGEQLKSKNPSEHHAEVIILAKKLDNSLDESTSLYTEESVLAVKERRQVFEEGKEEEYILYHEGLLERVSSLEPALQENIKELTQISKKIQELTNHVKKLNGYEKKILSSLGSMNKLIQKKLYSLSDLQMKGNLTDSYNEAKSISGLLHKRESMLEKKKHHIKKQLNLLKKIKHLQSEEKKGLKDIQKKEKHVETGLKEAA